METNVEKVISGKVVILGDQGVGKTSLVLRYVEREYNKYISPTIGASYFSCSIHLRGTMVKLQIWDTAGQERFKAMAPMFYRNATAAMLVFDITRPETFENLKKWVLELKGNAEDHLVLSIIGNKLDLANERKVPRDEAITYSNSIGASYHECSALEDQGIEQVFESAAFEIAKSSRDVLFTRSTNTSSDDCESEFGISSESSANDVGTVVVLRGSKDSIAHGDALKSGCC